MPVEVLEPGLVRVTPDPLDAKDIVEYAEALIEAHGWNDTKEGYKASNEQSGFTLHDALGEAGTRLTGGGKGGSLREPAQSLVQKVLGRKTDMDFNDKAKDKQEVLGVLREARA